MEKKFQTILNNTEKSVIASNSSMVELATFADYLRVNKSLETAQL